jgi:DNA-binding transcriptional regulator YhcF (GntR family)
MEWLRASFYLGKLSAGDRLPSHRELAKQLRISPTTALELYKALETEGVLNSRERSGTFLRHIAIEAERNPKQLAVFDLVRTTIERLNLLSFSISDYVRLLRLFTGAEIRKDFTFGFLMHAEAFEIATATIRQTCLAMLPMVRLSPDADDACSAQTVLGRDKNIRCLVATYLHVEFATRLAKQFGRHVLLARPQKTAEAVFDLPLGCRRYIVTRDRSTAEDLAALIRKIFEPNKAEHFVISSLQDPELLAQIGREADEVLVSPMAYSDARARFEPMKRLELIPSNVSDDTIDEMWFHYFFA